MNLFSDPTNLILALPVEIILTDQYQIDKTKEGWQNFLARARSRFLVEMLDKNTLDVTKGILEIDEGTSLLGGALARNGIRSKIIKPFEIVSANPTGVYGLGVSHTQLEHFSSLDQVDQSLNFLAQRSAYGMVHQVHAANDPGFELDPTHYLRKTAYQWEHYFQSWAEDHAAQGWVYLGKHRGAPARPYNFVLERDGSLPFYKYYDKQVTRRVVAELSLANGISVGRIPLLLYAFSFAKDNPVALSALILVVHALDAADGFAARKGFGNSPLGPSVDIGVDHFVELYTTFQFAYEMHYIPEWVFKALASRDAFVDFLRIYNMCRVGLDAQTAHPHEAFGTKSDFSGKVSKTLYEMVKAFGDATIAVVPSLGFNISLMHMAASFYRAMPVITSSTSKEIYRDIYMHVQKIYKKISAEIKEKESGK